MSLATIETENRYRRAVLLAVQTPDNGDLGFAGSLAELGRLAATLGLEVEGTVTQKRTSFHAATYIGKGKIDEVKALVAARDADVVLVDHEISPSQARNLEKALEAEVLDRAGLILEIFHRHAHSRAAKAQVEIVRLQYMAPRLREKGAGADRQQGGIGGKGAGESSLELDRRKIRDRVAELTIELGQIENEAAAQRARRRDMNRVALVGYTNAGKSTIMRALTRSDVYVADKLFATLDTTVRVMVPHTLPRVLVSDTVGFIANLPHGLIASFKSTLDEALEASLLLHVVDISDRGWRRQLDVTREVLTEIGAGAIPRIVVFNKFDRVAGGTDRAAVAAVAAAGWPDAVLMSARDPADIARLHGIIAAFFQGALVEDEILVPYDQQQLRSGIFAACEVLGERYIEGGVVFRLKASRAALEHLRESLARTTT